MKSSRHVTMRKVLKSRSTVAITVQYVVHLQYAAAAKAAIREKVGRSGR